MVAMIKVAAVLCVSALLAGCSGSSAGVSSDSANQTATRPPAARGTPSRFTQMKKGPTDPDLAALSAAGAKFEAALLGTFRFNKPGPEKTDPAARETRVKEVMHRFMCSFFDESIDLSRHSGAAAVKQTLSDVDMDDNASGEDADVAKFTSALGQVFKDSQLDVMSGSASGNNTAGEVMGVYDIAHNEILFFGFTNCGSDD
jgi:hypothetical protein